MQINSQDRRRSVRSIFLVVLVANLALAITKLMYGVSGGLLTMVADGLHSLLDCSANALAAVGSHISMKPPDADHPYGHRKFEALAAMIISFVMFFSCYEISTEAFHRFCTHEQIQHVTILGYLILALALVTNVIVTRFEQHYARKLNNSLLLADSKHSMSDVYTTLVVLVSLISVQLKMPYLDLISSLVIVAVMLHAGYQIIVAHLGMLVDQVVFDSHEIERVVMDVPGVKGCHKVRSRGTSDHVFIDLHVQVARHISIEEAHNISFQVEHALKNFSKREVDVLVHVEDDNPPVAAHH
jgi:cation diffusion facilitator family transporter